MNPGRDPMNRGRRRIDVPALIFGLLFLGVATWWLVDRDFALQIPNAGWLVALILIGGGALGITRAIRAGTDRSTARAPAAPADAPADPRTDD